MSIKKEVSLSVIVCVYRDIESLSLICDQFEQCVSPDESYEIIFVNDGNINNDVYSALEQIAARKNVRVIHLSRNFGQHVAIAAGMKNARGQYVLVMDSDLQFLPADCYKMYAWSKSNKHDAVLSVVSRRAHSFFKRTGARIYYATMTFLGTPQRGDVGSVFLVSQHVCEGLLRICDRYRMTIPLIYWLGGDLAYYEVPHYPRMHGRSSYNLYRLIKHAVNGVTSFSNKPLYISLIFSSVFACIAIAIIIELLVQRILFGEAFLPGWLSSVLVTLVSSSFNLVCLGIIGIYLGRVFESNHGRPLYFVQKQSKNEALLFEDERQDS